MRSMVVIGKYMTYPSRSMRMSPGSCPRNGIFPHRKSPSRTRTTPVITRSFPIAVNPSMPAMIPNSPAVQRRPAQRMHCQRRCGGLS